MIITAYGITELLQVFRGSNGDATKRLYDALQNIGPQGVIAMNLFRAQKCSERAKGYTRRGHKDDAYARKQYSMDELCKALIANDLGFTWGWGIDEKQVVHKHVLYVDLPSGQASFHTEYRGKGPDYPGRWDGQPGQSAQRILTWIGRHVFADDLPESKIERCGNCRHVFGGATPACGFYASQFYRKGVPEHGWCDRFDLKVLA